MEIGDVLKKPFTDMGKLVVGTILGIIPVVNFTVLGFGIENFKSPKKLPDFSFDQFILGVKAFLVGIVYSLVPVTLAVLGVYLGYTSLVAFSVVVALAILPAITRAILELSENNSFKAGLNFNKIIGNTYNMAFLIPWLISTFLSFAVSTILGFVPVYVSTLLQGTEFISVIFQGFISYVSAVVFWTHLGSRVKI